MEQDEFAYMDSDFYGEEEEGESSSDSEEAELEQEEESQSEDDQEDMSMIFDQADMVGLNINAS